MTGEPGGQQSERMYSPPTDAVAATGAGDDVGDAGVCRTHPCSRTLYAEYR